MSDNRIVFATGNEGKMKEIRLILADLGMEILSMKEAGADPEIVEDGKTFGENAEIKAKAVWAETGGIVLADDSGLVVDCLNGEPGIYSARYMGEDTSYEIKNQTIISRVNEAAGDDRSARFVCNSAAGWKCYPYGRDHGGNHCRKSGGKWRLWIRSDPLPAGVRSDQRGDYHGAEKPDQPPRKSA